MANAYADLPLPAGDGPGASVDVSSFGSPKTITVQGEFRDRSGAGPQIDIEVSHDNTNFFPIASFAGPDYLVVEVAAMWMRTFVRGFDPLLPFTPNVDVASNDNGADSVAIPTTAADGVGAPVDVSALGTLNTAVAIGTFTGTLTLEFSVDGTDWSQAMSFTKSGLKSALFTAQFVRARRAGTDPQLPGTVALQLCAVDDSGGGGLVLHSLGGVFHSADTFANLTAKVTDQTLAALGLVQEFEKNQRTAPVSLSVVAGEVDVDAELSNDFYFELTDATQELKNPTNGVAGMRILFAVKTGLTGRILTYDTQYDWGADGEPDIEGMATDEYALIWAYAIPGTAPLIWSCSASLGYGP